MCFKYAVRCLVRIFEQVQAERDLKHKDRLNTTNVKLDCMSLTLQVLTLTDLNSWIMQAFGTCFGSARMGSAWRIKTSQAETHQTHKYQGRYPPEPPCLGWRWPHVLCANSKLLTSSLWVITTSINISASSASRTQGKTLFKETRTDFKHTWTKTQLQHTCTHTQLQHTYYTKATPTYLLHKNISNVPTAHKRFNIHHSFNVLLHNEPPTTQQ